MKRLIQNGFTLIELLVVMAIIATLLMIVVPRYFHSVENSEVAVLRQNLSLTREALDKFYGDNGRYPDSLQELVEKRYLRSLPADPIAGNSDSWVLVAPDTAEKGGIYDIRSSAPGSSRTGAEYKDL